jgi:8-oxo-dGTP pyrophosphatase MutT (NUDIX family)
MRARVDALGQGEPPAVPKHASTVVLLRENGASAGMQACLLRRVRTMAFAAGMHVFPGGSVDPADAIEPTEAPDGSISDWLGPGPAQWARVLTADVALARALVCAAVRETFEESGVLLAGPDASSIADTDPVADPSWETDRQGLLDRRFSLSELLHRRGLRLRADLLRPWAHWVTPEFEPKRFDTRFFVAAVPPGQRPRDVSGEADSTVWLPLRDAVTRHDGGELDMLPPTIVALRELAAFDTVAEVLAAPREVRRVLPRLVDDAGILRLLIEDDA